MNKLYALIFLLSLCLGAFSQEITVRFTGQLNGTSYCRLDSVAVTNLTRDWTETVEYPDTIIVLGGTVGTDLNIVATQGLGQNIPNPFDCETRVELSVSQRENVRMQLLDASGKQYAEYSGSLDAGVHTFDISAAAPQTYVLNATVGSRSYSIRMVNMGSGCGSSIKYAGISGSITAKLNSTNEFQNGDNMRYVGYTTIEGDVVASTAVEQAQTISEVITLNFTHCINTFGTDIQSVCESYTWIDGVTYTESTNEPTFTLTNAAGCDSIVTLNLTINRNTGIDTQTACESYTWIDGVTYTESTTEPTFTLTNAAGCDSIVTLNLTINHSNTGIDEQVACESYMWIDDVTYTESTNEPTFTLTNAAGCDSVVTLHLTINHSNTGIDEQTACDSYTWIDDVTYTESTNEPTFTLTNAAGCDSVVTLHLTIKHSNTGIDEQTACESYTWIDGETYTESTNEPTFTLTNTIGCDSVVTLHLTINHSTTGIDEESACESYTWIDGVTYTESTNEPTFTLTNMAGCDSVVTLHLTIVCPPTVQTDAATDITTTGATLNGNVTSDGGAAVTARGFLYGTSESELTQTIQSGSGTGSFTATLADLSYGTTYYYKAYAINSEGTSYGEVMTFTTNNVYAPTVQTNDATDIIADGATLTGNVTSDGGVGVTARGFIYGTDANSLTQSIQSDSGAGSFTANLTSLTYGTTYYYKAYATNSIGTAYGEVMSFTTNSAANAATVQTNAATSITDIGATLSGDIISNGGATITERGFMYGTDASSLTHTVQSGSGNGNFTKAITGLTISTTYYYKAYATNSEGTSYGAVKSFTTLPYSSPTGYSNGHGYVDLGLPSGIKWATLNLSASSPERFGNYFAWGEIYTKGTFTTDNYRGYTGGSELIEEYDAATLRLGSEWRMPTSTEMNELYNNCTHTRMTINGCSGCLFTGPNGNSIFLPAAGYYDNSTLYDGQTCGYYWSRNGSYSPYAIELDILIGVNTHFRYYGQSIRAVCECVSAPIVSTTTATDITYMGATISGNVTSSGGASITERGFLYGTSESDLTQTVQSGSGMGSFTANLTGLSSSTTYYYKAYATNSFGTSYGEIMSFTTLATTGTLDGHDWVDLGLPSGTRWATCNIGATAPEDYGNYYAWGETSIKSTYDWSTYRYCDGNYNRLNKYCTNSTYGSTDNLTTLEVSDDAATAKWDSGWRMPTYDEMLELKNNCTVTWTTRNGVNGRLFTGPNGNSIFLPAAGYRGEELYRAGSEGHYWSKSLFESLPDDAWYLSARSDGYGMSHGYRIYGRSIRAVCEHMSTPIVKTTTATDITFTGATLTGKVIFFDDATITARGFLYGTSENNLTGEVQSGSGTGIFTANITGLTSGTTYYYKAYATNSEGTIYGEVLSITTMGTFNGHDWVDLGLPSGLRWATCNVGASSPEGYGDYYAWGETSTKTTYTENNYTYSSNPTTLPSSADAATANWGSGWRMPTYDEMLELKNNCTVKSVTRNGVKGRLLTGPNGNSIFLPSAGWRNGSDLISAGSYGYYMSSSIYTSPGTSPTQMWIYSSGGGVTQSSRYMGWSVRPVCPSNN